MDIKEKDLLEKIYSKISNSAVLNGGFDKLVHTVDNIVEKQRESTEKLENISETLFDPENGLYHKVKSIEFMMQGNKKTMENIETNQKTLPDEFNKNLSEKSNNLTTKFEKISLENAALKLEIIELNNIKGRLERIAGKDLEDIASAVKLSKHINKIIVSYITSSIAFIALFIWNLIKK